MARPHLAMQDILVKDAVERALAARDAADSAQGERWLGRAHRLAPADPDILYLLATTIAARDPARALAMLATALAGAPVHRDAHYARAALLRREGRTNEAADALHLALSTLAAPRSPAIHTLADTICRDAGRPGWIGITGEGVLLGLPASAPEACMLMLDGRPVRMVPGTAALSGSWRSARTLDATCDGERLTGAPIDLRAIRAISGRVWLVPGTATLEGWIASPADPDAVHIVDIHAGDDAAPFASVTAGDAYVETAPDIAALRPRGFSLALDLPPSVRCLRIRKRGGRALHGSLIRLAPHESVTAGASIVPRAVVLVTHEEGGGVERHVARRVREIEAGGARAIVVRPAGTFCTASGLEAGGGLMAYPAMAKRLRDAQPALVEFHHWAAHAPEAQALPAMLGVPYTVVLHDYAPICPRVTLCGGAARYCGEPETPSQCDDCVADHGARIPFAGDVATLRQEQAAFLSKAERVTVPSADTARRMARYMPFLRLAVTPWEDDAALTAVAPPRARPRDPGCIHVAVAGAIGRDKGYEILLACARDAERRALDLRFTLVGHTTDDLRLLRTGRVFITGAYEEGEALCLLAQDPADIGLIPSVWPETWCFALSALWQAGLHVTAFDLGAQAERIRATGAGQLLPLGLPARQINDALIRAAHAIRSLKDTQPEQRPRHVA